VDPVQVAEGLDVVAQIARFCRERRAKVRLIRGAEYALDDCERSQFD
jgi:hypothetical protein